LFRELNFTFHGDLSKRSMIFLLPVALAEVAGGGILPMESFGNISGGVRFS
jgi:hypothetical protein